MSWTGASTTTTNKPTENGDERYCSDSDDEHVVSLLRDFMRWIYRRLEAKYDYLTSDEYVIERVREEAIDLSDYINQGAARAPTREADEDE
jgi:hypothetical protein